MSKPPLTLNEIRKSGKIIPRNVGVADLLSKEDRDELRRRNAIRGKPKKKAAFDNIDAYIAEMIARFGYDTYQAWKRDEIDDVKMNRLLMAERARERQAWIPIELLLRNLIHGGVPVCMTKKLNTSSSKQVQKILSGEVKIAKGEF